MAKDTELYCRSCMVCQRSKLPMPTPVPMTNISNWTLREKESTLSREVEWEPASIEHFSVPADSTPQPDIVPEVPPAVLPPIDLEGQEAPPTLNHAQRRYPQRDRRPPDYYSVQF
eukprot:Em0012g425a